MKFSIIIPVFNVAPYLRFVVLHQPNAGVSAARNAELGAATGVAMW